ncbi:MAG: DUF4006 family protein [Sulfurimonas sp.]|uniref:DUF4006 family protein n=1 Tax=Sulfurimonas sp. TaxID=2022749 RepID=UPI0026262CB3|nr:DUF4006 family protein [Sulfurimonas sp.]MCW8895508.1 DUF4006 family protein [Sulfurimonas sp.]MCW8954510.1 DUF4006 family protein [Sulfurimonas sp.]
MNENRSLFALDGITGMLIATVLLLVILVGLSIWSLNVQNANMANFYEVKDEQSIKMFGSKAEDHIVTVGSK